MSLATLVVHDTCRSGVKLNYLAADISEDGIHQHPFLWTDKYWRPKSLTEETEEKAVTAAEKAVEVLQHNHIVHDGSGGDSGATYTSHLNAVLNAMLEYYRLLTVSIAEVLSDPEVDFVDVLQTQIANERVRCLYNIALVWMLSGLKLRNRMASASEKLTQAAGLFDYVLNCDIKVESPHNELSPDNLRIMGALCMAAAYEVSLQFHFKDSFLLVRENATLAHEVNFYYTIAAAIANNTTCIPDRDAMLNFCNIKRTFYEGLCFYLLSTEVDTNKGQSRRRKAIVNFETCLQHVLKVLPGDRRNVENELRIFTDKCQKFRKMVRKGKIPEAVFLQQHKRCVDHYPLMPTELEPSFPVALQFLKPPSSSTATPPTGGETKPSGGDEQAEPLIIADELPAAKFEDIFSVSVSVDHQDLRLNIPTLSPSDMSTKFHRVSALVELKAGAIPNNVPKLSESDADKNMSRTATVFVVDLNYPDDKLCNQMREIVAFATRSARLNENDLIGLVEFKDTGLANSVVLSPATEKVVVDTSLRMTALRGRGRHQGSKGSCLTSAVFAARDALSKVDTSRYTCREVVVVSDGWDKMLTTDLESWSMIMERGDELDDTIPVHTFAASTAADAELLAAFARRTGGNNGVYYNMEEKDAGIAAVRTWLSGVLATMKARVASNMKVCIECPKNSGVLIGSVLSTAYEEPATDHFQKLSKSHTLSLPPVATEETSHIVVNFVVPSDIAKHDVVTLGTITATCSTSLGCLEEGDEVHTKSCVVKNVCAKHVVDRENYSWLEQMFVDEFTGSSEIKTPAGAHGMLRGGEAVSVGDTVCTESSGRVSLASVEGCKVELDGKTDVQFDTINKKNINIKLNTGSINVKSSAGVDITIRVDNGFYTITVSPMSAVRVSFVDDMFHCNCILGRANIATEGQTETVKVFAPKQTSARAPNPPAMPWTITEDVFDAWVRNENDTAKQLRAVILMHTQQCRLIMSQALQQAARYVWRAKRGATLGQNKASQRCRTFLIFHILQKAKLYVSNSLAYATTNDALDDMRHEFDKAVRIGLPRNRFSLTWSDVVEMREISMSLKHERSRGCSSAFRTKDQKSQVEALLNAREKQALAAEEARLAAIRESRDAEQRRRSDILAGLFTAWDFAARNAVESRNISSALYSLPRHLPIVQTCIDRWNHVLSVLHTNITGPSTGNTRQGGPIPLDGNRVFTAEQLVSTLMYVTETLESFEFNTFSTLLALVLKNSTDAIDKDRVARALFSLFLKFDPNGTGRVQLKMIINDVNVTFGDDSPTFKRIQALTAAMIDEANALMHVEVPKIAPQQASNDEAFTPAKQLVANDEDEDDDDDTPTNAEKKDTETSGQDDDDEAPRGDESPAAKVDFALGDEDEADAKNHTEIDPTEEKPVTKSDDAPAEQEAPETASSTKEKAVPQEEPSTTTKRTPPPAPITPEPVTIDTIEHVDITITVFVKGFEAFLSDRDEVAAQNEIQRLYAYRVQKNPLPQDVDFVMRRERKDREKAHILTWDLPHIFDGVSRKNLQDIVAPRWVCPDHIQEIAAPICALASLTKQGNTIFDDDGALRIQKKEDYWATLKKILRRDPQGLFKFLEAYPVLSISHKQAQKVSQFLTNEPRFDPSILLGVSPVLSALCSWVHTILRVAFLEFDFEVPPPVCERLLSQVVASQNHVEQLVDVPPLPVTSTPPVAENIQKLQGRFSHHFHTVFNAPPIIGHSDLSRFKPLTPAAPLVTSNNKAPRVQSAPAQRAVMPLATASSAAAAASTTPVRTPQRPHTAMSPSNGGVTPTMQRPSSAYIRSASKTLNFKSRPSSASSARGASPPAAIAVGHLPSPPPHPRAAFQ